MKHIRFFIIVLLLLLAVPDGAFAWPADGDWNPIYYGSNMLSDPQKDSTGSRDIVGDATHAAAYLFNDGNYIYFRVRVDADPRENSGAALGPFGWGFLLDLNQNLDDYEYMIMLDGISNPGVMYLAANTQQGTLGDPSDKAELILWQETLSYNNNFRVLSGADFGGPTTTFGNDGDFYLDWFIPYDVFKSSMGLTDNSLIRYFVGSSNSAQTLSADLVQASTLYDGSSNYVVPSGKQPTNGSVYFVTSAAGTTDLNEFYAGATIYLKVIDADLNSAATSVQTSTVIVSAPSGDSQTVTLTETGLNTGIFTGPLATFDGSPLASNGILQVSPIEIVTVTYIDAADGATPTPLKNLVRNDTARTLPAADIAVSKSVNNPTPKEGDTVVYTVRAANNGPSNASGIQVTDQLPAGVTYVSHSAPAGTSYNPSTGLWSAGSLAKTSYKELTISAVVNSGTAQTTITNTASRTAASQPDPNSANDSALAAISVTGADLAVTKTVNNKIPAVGGTVRFTITVTNQGTYEATNVVLSDALPAATWSSVNIVSATHGSTTYSSGTLTWNIGTLPYPGTATLEVDATLAGGVASGTTVVNTASISHVDQKDPDPNDDSASATLVVGGIDLSVSKVVSSPSPATPNVGDTVVFTLTIGNNAAASTIATGIEVTDLLPADLTFVSAAPPPGTTYAQGNGKWSGISLAPGTSATLTLTATVKTGTAGRTIINTAKVTGYNQVDINTANHTASASVTVRSVDLEVTKTVDNPAPAGGASVTFTVTVKNTSATVAASGVSIFDQLPTQIVFNSANTNGNGSYSTTNSLWSGISLAPGASATMTLTGTVTLKQGDAKTFYNTASLNSSRPEDSNSTNDVASAVVSVNGTDLVLTKTMQTGYTNYPASGTTTKFAITLTNAGPNIATNIKVVDLYPTGLSCNNATTVSAGTFANNGGKCDWSVSSLAVGASATMILDSTVSAASGSTVTNRVTISAVDQSDPVAGNNTASKIIYVGASDVSLAKTVDNATPNVGDMVKFALTVTNNGANSVNGIAVTDVIPAGLTLVTTAPNAPTASQGTYNTATGVWTVGTVNYTAGPPEVKGTATLQLWATVNANTGGTTITNQAKITAAGSLDPNPTNDTATANITVQQADVYVNKEADRLTPYVGQTVTFTITAGNNGPTPATNLVVRDLLATAPDSFSSPSPVFTGLIATPSQGTYNSSTGDWSVGTLAKSTTATLTLTAVVAAGSEGKNITNTASKQSVDQTDANAVNDSATIVVTPQLLNIDLSLVKMVQTYSDPVHGTTNPYSIPGAVMRYTIFATNLGRGVADADSVVVSDAIPPQTDLVVSGTPVTFVDGTEASGLTFTLANDVAYFDATGTLITPSADGNGIDPAVRKIVVNPKGIFLGSDGTAPHPSFSIIFYVRVK